MNCTNSQTHSLSRMISLLPRESHSSLVSSSSFFNLSRSRFSRSSSLFFSANKSLTSAPCWPHHPQEGVEEVVPLAARHPSRTYPPGQRVVAIRIEDHHPIHSMGLPYMPPQLTPKPPPPQASDRPLYTNPMEHLGHGTGGMGFRTPDVSSPHGRSGHLKSCLHQAQQAQQG